MHGAGDVFRRPEGLQVREPGIHLRRRLGARGVLKHHFNTVDSHFLEVLFNDHRRWNESEVTRGRIFSDGLVHMAKRAARQQYAILVEHATRHGIAGVNVLGHRMIHEADRSNNRHLAAAYISFVYDAAHAAEMICMGVGIYHSGYRAFAELFIDKLQCRGSRFLGSQRVEYDPAGFTLDKAAVSKVVAANLVDFAGQYLIEAVGHVEHGLPLE